MKSKGIQDDIMDALRRHSKAEYYYINPNFLASIATLLEEYYDLEDDDVWDWIQGMYSA